MATGNAATSLFCGRHQVSSYDAEATEDDPDLGIYVELHEKAAVEATFCSAHL